MTRRLVLLTLFLFAHGVRAQDAPADPRLSERDRLVEQARALAAKGDLAGTRRALARVRALKEGIFGAVREETCLTQARLAQVCEGLNDFDAAREHLKQALAIRMKLSGKDHWKTIDARLARADLVKRVSLTREQRDLRPERLRSCRDSLLRKQSNTRKTMTKTKRLITLLALALGCASSKHDAPAAGEPPALTGDQLVIAERIEFTGADDKPVVPLPGLYRVGVKGASLALYMGAAKEPLLLRASKARLEPGTEQNSPPGDARAILVEGKKGSAVRAIWLRDSDGSIHGARGRLAGVRTRGELVESTEETLTTTDPIRSERDTEQPVSVLLTRGRNEYLQLGTGNPGASAWVDGWTRLYFN
ncbi:MAG: tetratricopeptide repeat protein [Planctomycetota bacterium]|jgi:hypothetical protein